MTPTLDCRGLACPEPVMRIKTLLDRERPAAFSVIVDNEAAWENIHRFLEYQHYQVDTHRLGADIQVAASRADATSGPVEETAPLPRPGPGATRKILVMVGADRLGHGDDGLGAGLLLSFVKTLTEMGPDLWRLVFVNSGVTLTSQGSAALPALRNLENQGVTILVCGACLTHFQLLEKKAVGQTTNMLDIVTAMQLADSVINI